MDDEYESDELDVDPAPRTIPARRARGLDFVVLLFILLQQIAEAFDTVLDHTVGVLAAHANFDRDRRDFAEDVRAELESIPTHEED